MSKTPEPVAEPARLSAAAIADGKLYPAGSETPFTEKTLPEHLRQYQTPRARKSRSGIRLREIFSRPLAA